MQTVLHVVTVLVLLAFALSASPAQAAGGVVDVCDEAHFLTALASGGTVTFACSGAITLSNTIVVSTNTSIDGTGQAVAISGNHAVGVFRVNSGATLNLNELTIADGNADYGGGIRNLGILTVSNSTFSANSAEYDGGGIYDQGGPVSISNSIFVGNSAGLGGGIYSRGSMLMVDDSAFSGNNAATRGGGLYITSPSLLAVSNSAFDDNSAGNSGGGIGIGNCPATVSKSTFFSNSAGDGGGVSIHSGGLTLSNSTLVGNSASRYGGAVIFSPGALTVSNSTFSGNYAPNGGGIANVSGMSGVVTLENTIVANSPTGGNCYGAITDGGGNLSYPDTTCPGIDADPVLGPLQDNGGPTETMALGEGSAAIDAGDDAICAAPPVDNLDQRGVARPQGAHCDIGAVEQFQESTAVSLSGFSAGSVPGAIPPVVVFGLLLVALAGIGAFRRTRPMGRD